MNGIWSKCNSVDLFQSDTYDDCLQYCKDLESGCTHFTHSPPSYKGYRGNPHLAGVAVCELFEGACEGPTDDPDCPTCMSGEQGCPTGESLKCSQDFCVQGSIFRSLRDTGFSDCLSTCNTNSSCAWFSHYNQTNVCQLMKDNVNQTHSGEGICLSGQRGCQDLEEPKCGFAELCDGNVVAEAYTSDAKTCLERCQKPGDCKWFSFHKTDNRCTLFDSCPKPFASDGNYISGEKRCTSLGTLFLI